MWRLCNFKSKRAGIRPQPDWGFRLQEQGIEITTFSLFLGSFWVFRSPLMNLQKALNQYICSFTVALQWITVSEKKCTTHLVINNKNFQKCKDFDHRWSILSLLSSLDRASMDPKPSLLVSTNFYMQHDSYWIEISNILRLYIEKNKEISLIGRFLFLEPL